MKNECVGPINKRIEKVVNDLKLKGLRSEAQEFLKKVIDCDNSYRREGIIENYEKML